MEDAMCQNSPKSKGKTLLTAYHQMDTVQRFYWFILLPTTSKWTGTHLFCSESEHWGLAHRRLLNICRMNEWNLPSPSFGEKHHKVTEKTVRKPGPGHCWGRVSRSPCGLGWGGFSVPDRPEWKAWNAPGHACGYSDARFRAVET